MFFNIINKKLELNLEYTLFYKEFKVVYDKYIEEGTDKVEKIFKYIYEVADYRSFCNRRGYDEIKTHDQAINTSGLDKDFRISKIIKDAIVFYKKDNYSVNVILLKDLEGTLNLSIKINERIKTLLESKLNTAELKEADISSIITLQSKLFEMIDGLPSKIDKVKQLQITVNDELSKPRPEGRGTGQIAPSFEGDPEIEGEL